MRTSTPRLFYPILLILLASLTAAWPLNWPRWLPELDSLVVRHNALEARQGSNSGSATAAATGSATQASNTGSSSNSATQHTGSDAGSATATATGTESKSGSNSGSKTSTKTATTSYDARLPAGGISMITPAVTSGTQYFKIGDYVTFGWNYTSLSATPTALNIMATCTENSQLYTIAMNQTVGPTGAVTWDTGAYQATAVQNPLLTETYTLIIYDAASSISATAQAGYLAVYNSYVFGMYTPQPYVPLDQYVCATCSGALGDMEKRALSMVFGVCAITVLSFTWFVSGTGIIW